MDLPRTERERWAGCPGFKLHLLCNEMGDALTFCLTPANVDDRNPRVWKVFTKVLYGKVFADKGYSKQEFFENLFNQGIHLVHGLKSNIKKQLMLLWDKMMLRKRHIIECINELLKNKANLFYSRHRSVHNFLMNLCAALAAYCFFENKLKGLPVRIEKSRQLKLFQTNLIPNWRKYEGKQLIPATKALHILITSVFTYEIIEVVSVKK